MGIKKSPDTMIRAFKCLALLLRVIEIKDFDSAYNANPSRVALL